MCTKKKKQMAGSRNIEMLICLPLSVVIYPNITPPWICVLCKKMNMINTATLKAWWTRLIKKKTWQFSEFLNTLYPDKPFIHCNPSMWQHGKQTTPRLWSCDSGLLFIIKQNVAAAVMLQWSETWQRHCTKTKYFPGCAKLQMCPRLFREYRQEE